MTRKRSSRTDKKRISVFHHWLPLLYYCLLSSVPIWPINAEEVSSCAQVYHDMIVLPEDTAPGTLIMNTTVNLLSLRTDTGRDFSSIEIENSTRGPRVRLLRSFDAETMDSQYQSYPVFCGNTPTDFIKRTEIRIFVTDSNEFAPVFPKPSYSASIPETTSVHSIVFSFNNAENGAFDPDVSKENIIYRIASSNDASEPFYITFEGDLVLNKTLDFEKSKRNFVLVIEAKEPGTEEQLSSQTNLTIHVEDSDDNNPVFSNPFYTMSLPEGVYDGRVSYPTKPVISAEDGDATLNETILYSIDASSQAIYKDLFALDAGRSVTVTGTLFIGTYNVNIRAAQVDKPTERYSVVVVVITVTDVNNNAPVMGSQFYNTSVNEGMLPGSRILTVTAEDGDLGDNAVFRFELDDPSNTFEIETKGEQGEIHLTKPLDRETTAIYIFKVWAVETKTTEAFRSAPSQVTVRVLDKNDNSPVFRKDNYVFDVRRTEVKGKSIGQVIADDEDIGSNGLVYFYFQPPPAWDWLKLGNVSGVLSLERNLTLDDVGSYVTNVVASDQSATEARSTATQITINVLAVNENRPIFVRPAQPAVLNISESVEPGTVVLTVQAEDLDGDPIQYTIQPGGNAGGRFSINSLTGEITLTTRVNLDSADATVRLSPLTVTIAVEAKDNLVHTTVLEIIVNFQYVNEFAPIFEPTSTASVFENATRGQKIAQVTATDKDSGQDGVLKYSLLAPVVPPDTFHIDPNNGLITLACSNCLNFNTRSFYTLVIKVEDGGVPPRIALTTLLVRVTETVLVPPAFPRTAYRLEWQENKPPGFLIQMEAEDSDTDSIRLTYSLSGQPNPLEAGNKIKVYSNGTIVTTESFDAEKIPYFSAEIKVTDGNSEAFTMLWVNITDVNDNDPVLNVTDSSVFRVPENSKIGTVVTTIAATDDDISNEGFTFWLGSGGQGKFRLDQTSGVLTVSGQLDRKVTTSYNLTIHASDFGAPPRIVQATVTVEIEDSNTGPIFVDSRGDRSSRFEFNITEDAQIGELLGVLKAFDPDSGSSGDLKYNIVSGDPTHHFSLDPSTGNLTLAAPLNYEQTSSYALAATVTDNSFVPASDSAAVDIRVINVVEAPQWPLPLPVLYLTQTSACSPRLSAFSRELTSVSSQSDEATDYRLVNQSGEFWINSTTGLLHTNTTLEAKDYVLTLQACSRGSDVCSTANLVVVVRSDEILAFCPAFYRVEVNESSPINQTILDLPTSKPNAEALYEIKDGNEAGRFAIEPNSGRVFVREHLDRETTDQFTLIVTATLKNFPTETAQAQIIIAVLDSPDTPPSFASSEYRGEITEEDIPISPVYVPGTSLNLVITATDADENPQFTYSIDQSTDSSNGSFAIDSKGQLSLVKSIDFETMDPSLDGMFHFNVSVDDGYFHTSVPVTVLVKDTNDNWPEFSSSEQIVDINVTENGVVPRDLVPFPSCDPDLIDKGRLKYSLIVVDPPGIASPFSIDSHTGILRLERRLDREDVSSYLLNVIVTDSNPDHKAIQNVSVSVIDLNDNTPMFQQNTYRMEVMEGDGGNGTNITLVATDADNGQNALLTYRLESIGDGLRTSFSLSRVDRGVTLFTVKPLDRELVEKFSLVVIATDGGDPQRSGQCTVRVTVKDINDNKPEFDLAGRKLFTAQVQENSANNTVISVDPPISVKDVDQGENGEAGIHFTLRPVAEANNTSGDTLDLPFIVDDATRKLMVRYNTDGETLDRENKSVYDMEIVATDQLGRGLSATARLLVTITDVDDVAPRFIETNYTFRIPENSDPGTPVGSVRADDDDLTQSLVVYSLKGSRLFSIQPFSGLISVAGSLDRERSKAEDLTVSACDLNGCDSTNVTVVIADVNDNCPVWNTSTLTFFVTEDQGAGSSLGNVQASDRDQGLNGEVNYYLNDTTALRFIEVSSSSGEVTLKSHVDDTDLRDDENFLKFPVYAEDKGSPSCATLGEIKLVVRGVNDNPPEICFKTVCGVDEIKLSVLDKSAADTVIGQVEARDIDTGPDGDVTFSFKSEQDGVVELFNISSSGIITLAQKIILGDLRQNGQVSYLSGYSNNTLLLTLVATDGGRTPKSGNASVLVTIESSASDAPVFTQFDYHMDIPENSPAGTTVGVVNASSPRGSQLTYSIPTGGQTQPFAIEPITGKIITTAQLDRETQSQYQFVVSAVDPFLPAFSTSAVVTVLVTDKNDNKPVFPQSYISLTVLENDVTSSILATFEARDDDVSDNGKIQYSIVGDGLAGIFSINSTSGDLRVLQPLDREINPTYDFIVQASDGNFTADANVHIQVLDDNDHWPEFSQSVYQVVVIRSSSIRQTVVRVKATDQDSGPNAQVVYTLADSEDSPLFTINYLSGEIDSIAPLPRDSYSLVVLAADQGMPPRVSNASVLIDVKDNDTEVIPSVLLSARYVSLIVGMASGVQLPLNVTTVNAAKLTISAGNERGWFKLTEDGYIFLEKNVTEVALFELSITATSVTGNSASTQLQVAAVPLSFDQPDYIVSVPENSQVPVTLLDLGSYPESLGIPVIYSIVQPSFGVFSVDSMNGSLKLLQKLDRETSSTHVLDIRLRLRDEYEGAFPASASVVVRVTDENDNAPSFGSIGPTLRLDLPENATAPWFITKITAFDPDEGLNGLIAYTISEGDTTSFSVNRNTGNLRMVNHSPFNKLGTSTARLTVIATDRNGTGRSTSLEVEIYSVRKTYQFKLLAPISSSTFSDNQNQIVRQLSDILSLQLVVDDVLVHSDDNGLDTNRADVLLQALDPRTNASVPQDSIQRRITEKESEIRQVFQGYMDDVTVTKASRDDGFSAATVALIVIGCIMFVVCIVAILVVVRLWRRQKEYAAREETAVRARQRVEDRLERQKQSANNATASSKVSDDPDQDFEMEDVLTRHNRTGPLTSEGSNYDNDMYFFPPKRMTSCSDHVISRSQDSLHLQDISGSRLINAVGGASSMDSGIDYTGEGDGFKVSSNWSLRRAPPSPREIISMVNGDMQLRNSDQNRPANNANHSIVNALENATYMANVSQNGDVLNPPESANNSSSRRLTSFESSSTNNNNDIGEAQGCVEMKFVNQTYHRDTDVGDLTAETTDCLTRL